VFNSIKGFFKISINNIGSLIIGKKVLLPLLCFIVIKLVRHNLLLRNACCCGAKIFLNLSVSLLFIILENIIGRIEIIDIGW